MLRTLLPLLALLLLTGCKDFDKDTNVIYLIGDSTMAPKNENKRPETGWGEALGTYFEEGIRIDNHARNGRSSRSFITEGRWQTVLDKLNTGDYVFIQFGHNDPKPDTSRFSSPADYAKNLTRFVTESRAKGAHPVILTPVMRRRYDEQGAFYDTHGEYPGAARMVAEEQDVPLIDMHRKSGALLTRLGEEASLELFLWLAPTEHPNYPDGVEDNTHFSQSGARAMAGLAAEGIVEARLPLRRYLRKP